MRLLHVVVLSTEALSALAQTPEADPSPTLTTLPRCALSCITTAASHSVCAITNQTCLCTDKALQEDVQLCVAANCTIKESLFTKNATTTACHSTVRNRQTVLITTSTTLGIFTALIVFVRLGFKIFARTPSGLDDWLILATFLLGLPNTVMNIYGTTAHGLGRDVWTLSFDDISSFALFTYIQAPFYFAELAFLKLSLLAFFLRIFPFQPVRWLLWATFVFVSVYGIVFVSLGIFQCKPIDFAWTRWAEENPSSGQCLDIFIAAWVNAGISIILDFWMLAIPLYQVRQLHLHWKKKVGVVLMFCIGTFITVVSILRLQSLLVYGHSTNPTWDNVEISVWSTVEINVGIICACMPALRLLLARLFPVIAGSSPRSDNKLSKRSRDRSKGHFIPEKESSSAAYMRSDADILRTNSSTVEHDAADDHDEAGLFQMKDLVRKSSYTLSIGSSTSPL